MAAINPREVSCDIEGENLGKFGRISLVSIGVTPPNSVGGDVRVFVFDFLQKNLSLKQASIDVVKDIMEDSTISKIIHDCRGDRATLFYATKPSIELTSVFDTSVWDLELRILKKSWTIRRGGAH